MDTEEDNFCAKTVADLKQSDAKLAELFSDKFTSGIVINCRKCMTDGIEGRARAALMDFPFQIVLCSNRLSSKSAVREALVHELVHAYDYVNNRYDMATCEGLAASEIRAAREGECAVYENSYLPFFKSMCIKDTAFKSTRNLFPERDAQFCVERMFNIAMKDISLSHKEKR